VKINKEEVMEYLMDIIKKLYAIGAMNLKQVFDLTTVRTITKEQFHSITTYDYNGIKETKGW
jgi:hypothetical protein